MNRRIHHGCFTDTRSTTAVVALLALLATAVMALSPAAVSGGKIYTWTDAQGNVHMTDRPPPTDGRLIQKFDYSPMPAQELRRLEAEKQAAWAAEKQAEQERQQQQTLESAVSQRKRFKQKTDDLRADAARKAVLADVAASKVEELVAQVKRKQKYKQKSFKPQVDAARETAQRARAEADRAQRLLEAAEKQELAAEARIKALLEQQGVSVDP